MSLWTHLKKVLNMLVMPCWFGSVPFSELVAVGKLVFEAEVLVESARGVFVVIGAGAERDWSLDLEHCLYQHRPTQTPIPTPTIIIRYNNSLFLLRVFSSSSK